ncbi:DUF5658 family protein [Thermodesulfobacteriota bacterium]
MKTKPNLREYRSGEDRRKRKIPPLKYLLFGGRRKRIRRKEDENELIILDTHGQWVIVLAVIILVLSITDGLLTLNLIGKGASETNPLMFYLIELNPCIYFFTKCFLTAICVIILILFRNYRSKIFRVRVTNLLPMIAVLFIIVIFYQLHLKFQLAVSG